MRGLKARVLCVQVAFEGEALSALIQAANVQQSRRKTFEDGGLGL